MTTLVDAAKDITKVLLSQEGVSEYDIMEYLLLGLIRFDFIPTENRTKQYKHKKAKRTSPQQQSTTTNVNSIKTIHGAVSEQQTSQTIDQSYNLNMLKSRSNIESNLNRGKRLIINLERIATTKLKKEDLTDEHLNALQASSKSNNDELVEDVNKIIDPVTSELTKEDLTDEHLNTLQASSKSNNDELVEDVDKIIDPVTSEITKEDLTDEHLNTLQASSKSNNDELVEDVDKIIDPVTSEITKEDLTDEHLNALQASSKSNNDESHEKKKKIDPDKYNSQNSSSEPSTDDKIKWLTQECQVARESFLKAAEGFRNTSATMTCFPEFQILCCCHPSLFLDMCSNFMDELDDQLDKCFKAYQQVNEKSDELLYLETSKTKITLETSIAWKNRKLKEQQQKAVKDEEKKRSNYKAGRQVGISERAMFFDNTELAAGDVADDGNEAIANYDFEREEESVEYRKLDLNHLVLEASQVDNTAMND
uniref:ZC3H15/TMA46 family C-terminal domain-containing protein n=1 Tax=Trichogramma kaykai TaxID=54128 RepID=A0ABD2X6B6_9HYME